MLIKTSAAALLSAMAFSALAADTVPGEQAEKNGFSACQKTVENLAKFVVKSNNHSSLSTWNKKATDTRLFNAQVVINYPDGAAVSILNVAPTKGGKCDSAYTTITSFEKSCAVLRETMFSDWKFSTELGGLLVLENKSGSVNIILLPAANGCTSIKSEVAYE